MYGRTEPLKLRPGHRNIKDYSEMYSSAIPGCREEGSGGGTTFRDFFKLPGHTKLIPWPEIRTAAAKRALDRQAWLDAVKNLAPLEFKKPQQVGRPGLVNDALCNHCDLAAEDIEVIASGKTSVKGKESMFAQMDAWMDERMYTRMDTWMHGHIDTWMDAWTHGRKDGRIGKRLKAWVDWQMDGHMDGCMDAQPDEYKAGATEDKWPRGCLGVSEGMRERQNAWRQQRDAGARVRGGISPPAGTLF
eukprot:357886-Chlamydomonas_euryale.AAC.15